MVRTSRTPLLPLDRCPNELWARVFSFACLDGTTNRALALVSRQVRELSEPFRCLAFAVYGGHKRISSLANFIETRRERSPGPYHLYIWIPGTDHLEESDDEGADAGPHAPDLRCYDAMLRLLAVSGPTLQTLAIHGYTQWAWAYSNTLARPLCAPVVLPHLDTLVLAPRLLPLFAALLHTVARVHVHTCGTAHALGKHLDALARSAALERLRLSDIGIDPGLPRALALFAQARLEGRTAFRALVVQPKRVRAVGVDLQMPVLERVVGMILEGEFFGQVALWPIREEYGAASALEDWVDAINGGDRIWTAGTCVTKAED